MNRAFNSRQLTELDSKDHASPSPMVSVVLPTYNRAPLLGRAIRSVLNQTYRDFELIIVDDGSTDQTDQLVRQIEDPRVRYIQHDHNQGAAAARNTAIQASRGSYIAFQDSDDEWLPEKLEKQLQVFNSVSDVSPEVGVVYCQFLRIKGNHKVIFPSKYLKNIEGNIHNSLLNKNYITTQSALVRRECFERVGGFDQDLPCLMDWDLWIRISRYYQFRFFPEPLEIINYTPDSISTHPLRLAEAFEKILAKYSTSIQQSKHLLAQYFYIIGNLCSLGGDLHKGQRYLFRAIKTDPLRFRYWIAALLSLLGANCYQRAYNLKGRIRADWY